MQTGLRWQMTDGWHSKQYPGLPDRMIPTHLPLCQPTRQYPRTAPTRTTPPGQIRPAASDGPQRLARETCAPAASASLSPLRLRCSAVFGLASPLSPSSAGSDRRAAIRVLAPTVRDSCLAGAARRLGDAVPRRRGGSSAARPPFIQPLPIWAANLPLIAAGHPQRTRGAAARCLSHPPAGTFNGSGAPGRHMHGRRRRKQRARDVTLDDD